MALIDKYPDLKVIMAPTSVGHRRCCQGASRTPDLCDTIKVSGLGVPSEMKDYTLDGCAPEFALWSFVDLGYLTYYASYLLATGAIQGVEGETFKIGRPIAATSTFTIEKDPTRDAGPPRAHGSLHRLRRLNNEEAAVKESLDAPAASAAPAASPCGLTFPGHRAPGPRERAGGLSHVRVARRVSCPRGAHRAVRTPIPARSTCSVPDATAVPAWATRGQVAVDARAARRPSPRPCSGGSARGRRDARLTAETLVLADARGHPSHGVSRLRQYTRLLTSGSIDPAARHERVARRTAFEVWDAQHGLGPAVGHRAMDRAIVLARRAGIGAVTVRDAGHFGIAGAYVLRALDAGMVGIAIGNATPGVPPTGAVEPALGTNPIAIGAPDGEGRGFLLDMATSVVALGKVEVAQRAGRAIPSGWALDKLGSTDDRPDRGPRGRHDAAARRAVRDRWAQGLRPRVGGRHPHGRARGRDVRSRRDGDVGYGQAHDQQPAAPSDRPCRRWWGRRLRCTASCVAASRWSRERELRAWRKILVAGDPEWRASDRQAERVDLLPEVIRDLAALAVEHGLLRRWRPVVSS